MPPWLVSWGGCCLRGAARSLEFTTSGGFLPRAENAAQSHPAALSAR